MKNIGLALILLTAVACKTTSDNSGSDDQYSNERFDSYKQRFVEELWQMYPNWASGQGYHKYDDRLNVLSEENLKKQIDFSKAHLDTLKKYDPNKLAANNRTDYYLIENQLKAAIWDIEKYRSFEWNPATYNVGEGFADIVSGKYAPLEDRLHSLNTRMNYVKAYYAAAKVFLKNPTIEHTALAIEQNKGAASVFTGMLKDSLSHSKLGAHEQQMMLAKVDSCVAAINDYINFLSNMKNEHPRSFRLGKDLYSDKFKYDIQSAYSAEEIYKKATKRKGELHDEMFKLTKEMWPKYFSDQKMPDDKLKAIRIMIDRLSTEHVHRDSFQLAIEKQIPELVDFINKHDIIYLDPSKPLVVRKEPEYMQGVAGASISAPGPYDKNANTYYNVGSLASYSKEDAESYLREYNKYILQILNIHEAIPGHYTQLIYSNNSPSIIKSILGNGAMVEGWAVYTERMMLEQGYGGNTPEMWLMYYKWHLRVVCNTILDYGVHVKGISQDEAMDLLVNQAFQQEAEAKGKWRRVSVTSVQLCSYFTGFTEIYDLREEMKKKQGDKFNLKKFHEEFLSYGSAPVKYIKELIIDNKEIQK
jgi:uncharacterized protein (DUF885 family)